MEELPRKPDTPNTGKSHTGKTKALHHHKVGNTLVACYHSCRHRWYIWAPILYILQSIMFPFEHETAEWLWSQPVFTDVGHFLGVIEDHD